MSDRWDFFKGALEAPLGIAKRRFDLRLHSNERMGCDEFNKWLYCRIKDGTPTAVVRFGGTEMKSLRKYEFHKISGLNVGYDSECKKLCELSGFFPDEASLIPDFCEENIKYLSAVDAIGVWDLPFERYFVKKYLKQPVQTELENLEPYNSSIPWTGALENCKVLVVHPFIESIVSQYEKNREVLFENPSVLPEFKLVGFKAVQSLGGVPDGEYASWFEALEDMYTKIREIDFDVAILGCGAYGMPLALRIKNDGKIAIHMGGATQMLFGVYGKRWENSELINEHWIRPSIKEKATNADNVEKGCYW